MKKRIVTRLDYCQYLMVSQTNDTLTYYADHHPEGITHDHINRYLRGDKLTPALVWEQVKDDIVLSDNGYLIFDDTVLDKNHSHAIELVNKQYSGNAHGLIKGIGVVTCVYVNPDTEQYWVIDYRIYDKHSDGKTKLDHLAEILEHSVYHKQLAFSTVLMDSWYATKKIMMLIDSMDNIYYCPLKSNRKVDDSKGVNPYKQVSQLDWSDDELEHGKLIKIHGFPKDCKVKLFRVAVTNRTDWVVTGDTTQNTTDDIQKVCAIRWKIEQFHRELKQLTGVEKNQCRKARIQRNHVCCSMLVWVAFNRLAKQFNQTMYQLKQGLLDAYLCEQLRSPSLRVA